jgi:hypothetical protein
MMQLRLERGAVVYWILDALASAVKVSNTWYGDAMPEAPIVDYGPRVMAPNTVFRPKVFFFRGGWHDGSKLAIVLGQSWPMGHYATV